MTAETNHTAVATATGTEDAIVVERVRKTYGTGPQQVLALDDVSFVVPAGTVTALVGRSGSGKSTLLNLLGALDRPSSGAIRLYGSATSGMSDSELTQLRLREVGFVFQQFNLISNLSALENIELPLQFAATPPARRRERALQLLHEVGLEHRSDHRPGKLSGGEQQRVAIARALANDPPLLLADEPTGNLDSRTGEQVMELLNRLVREHGKTLLLVTHDEDLAATANLRLQLADGRLTRVDREEAPDWSDTGGTRESST